MQAISQPTALMQNDDDGDDRFILYLFCLLKSAELIHSIDEKDLLSIKYALVKPCVHLLGIDSYVSIRIAYHCGPS